MAKASRNHQDYVEVTASGHYAWSKRPPSQRQRDDDRLDVEIHAAHKRTRETYRPERLSRDLKDKGVVVTANRDKRIRKELGLRCKQKKKFKTKTNAKHTLPVVENLQWQQFSATAQDRIWVTDITYISIDEGWLYLAGHKDLFTGEIVEYAMPEGMTKNLVNQSLFRAVASRRPPARLIVQTERESKDCSGEYREMRGQFEQGKVAIGSHFGGE